VSLADAAIARLPKALQPYLLRHHELIKFAIVGGTTFVIDSAIFYTLKLTILEPKPVTAKVIAGIVAVIASYVLNREWSFRDRGGRERHHEALLFFAFSGVGVLLSMAPLWVSSYVLQLRVPTVSLTLENIADFISAYVIGVPALGVPRPVRAQPREGAGIRPYRGRYRRGLRGRHRGRLARRQRHPVARLAPQGGPVHSARRLLGTQGVENLVI